MWEWGLAFLDQIDAG
jgi:hypothetical protein